MKHAKMSKRKTDEVSTASAVTGYIQQTSDIKKAKKSEHAFLMEICKYQTMNLLDSLVFRQKKKTPSFLLKT